MVPVSLYPNGLPCKCETDCDFRLAWFDAGSPTELQDRIIFEKDTIEFTPIELLQRKFAQTKYCKNK